MNAFEIDLRRERVSKTSSNLASQIVIDKPPEAIYPAVAEAALTHPSCTLYDGRTAVGWRSDGGACAEEDLLSPSVLI
jgi:hypothetical protein